MSTPASNYLDSASGMPLHPIARETLLAALDQGYADPRRLHHPGRVARLLLDNARAAIAEVLAVRPDEISFTGSGTDAVHRGLLGLHQGRRREGSTIAHSAIEHSAVLAAGRWSAAPLVPLPVDRGGVVSSPALAAALTNADQPLSLAAIQLANPEVGVIQPIETLAEQLGEVPLFMDACAGTGHLDWPAGWSVAAASAHKWGGPAGVGVLAIRRGTRWRNPFPADERIDPRVSGFENTPAILAAAAAIQAVVRSRAEEANRRQALTRQLRHAIGAISDVEIVSPAEGGLPHLFAFSCLYLDGEALVTELDRRGFGVASGSACTSSALAPSHVLAAMGVLTQGNVRVSVHSVTSERDVAAFGRAVADVIADLRGRVGLPDG
ncbi:MAG: cysteine desulfurase family protein [Nocardioides sp.]